MTKKNLPNIPIYIGDWERDCNVLSLECEMAWMKIVFKMHLSGKQSVYKSSTKGLQILWKSNLEKVNEILEELEFNNICQITEIKGGYEFLSRRLQKENSISEIRSIVASESHKSRKKTKNDDAKPLQKDCKTLQNTEIEIENEIKDEVKSIILNEDVYINLLLEYGFDKNLILEWFVVRKNKNVTNSTTFFKGFIKTVSESGIDKNEVLKVCVENSWATFKKTWYENLNKTNTNGTSTTKKSNVEYSDDFLRKIAVNLQS